MTTDRLAIAASTWDAVDAPAGQGHGWLARVRAALGRLFGRRPAFEILHPDEDRPRPVERTRPIDAADVVETVDRTRPIDARDVMAAAPLPPPLARAATHAPAPSPARPTSRRAASAPPTRRAPSSPGSDLELDPIDALITLLQATGEVERVPPPSADELEWMELLGPLIEYELMARGSTAQSFQSTAGQLAELVALDDTDFNGAVRLVSRDPAVAATVLAAANSAAHQRSHAVTDIRGAIDRLGVCETRRLGIVTAGRALHEPDARSLASHHRVRAGRDLHRAMTCAFACASLAARRGPAGDQDAFVSGMFFDVGRPLVHRAIIALERRQRVQPVPPHVLDTVIERTHAGVGAEALETWGLPRRLAELARHHLAPAPHPSVDGADLQRLALVSTLVLCRASEHVPLTAARRATAALGYDEADLRALALEVTDLAARVTELFGVHDRPTTWGGAAA